ncbi:MAG: hypothetical protein H7839_00430 [Magnetococcus sp. YQC-5]
MNKIAMRVAVLVATFGLAGGAMAGNDGLAAGQPAVQQADAQKTAPEAAKPTVDAKVASPTVGAAAQPVTHMADNKKAHEAAKTVAMTDGKQAPQEAAKTVANAQEAKKKTDQDANKNKQGVATKGGSTIDTTAQPEVKDNNVKK